MVDDEACKKSENEISMKTNDMEHYDSILTSTAFISAKRLVICLKYCSGAIACKSL
jgi:hypothetical protein